MWYEFINNTMRDSGGRDGKHIMLVLGTDVLPEKSICSSKAYAIHI